MEAGKRQRNFVVVVVAAAFIIAFSIIFQFKLTKTYWEMCEVE